VRFQKWQALANDYVIFERDGVLFRFEMNMGRPLFPEGDRVLIDLWSGRRPATVMQQLAKGYTDAQIEAAAAYFSAQAKQ